MRRLPCEQIIARWRTWWRWHKYKLALASKFRDGFCLAMLGSSTPWKRTGTYRQTSACIWPGNPSQSNGCWPLMEISDKESREYLPPLDYAVGHSSRSTRNSDLGEYQDSNAMRFARSYHKSEGDLFPPPADCKDLLLNYRPYCFNAHWERLPTL